MDTLFSWSALSALLILISAVPYAWGIYRRTVPRPVVSTWGLWAFLGLLLLVTYHGTGARLDTGLFAAVLGLTNPTIVVLLSLRYGAWTWTKLDTWCVALCIITVILWQTTHVAVLGLAGGLVADLFAAIPQIRKSWTQPEEEPLFPWLTFCLGSAVNLLAVEQHTFAGYLYPAYMTTVSFFSFTLPVILYRTRRA